MILNVEGLFGCWRFECLGIVWGGSGGDTCSSRSRRRTCLMVVVGVIMMMVVMTTMVPTHTCAPCPCASVLRLVAKSLLFELQFAPSTASLPAASPQSHTPAQHVTRLANKCRALASCCSSVVDISASCCSSVVDILASCSISVVDILASCSISVVNAPAAAARRRCFVPFPAPRARAPLAAQPASTAQSKAPPRCCC